MTAIRDSRVRRYEALQAEQRRDSIKAAAVVAGVLAATLGAFLGLVYVVVLAVRLAWGS